MAEYIEREALMAKLDDEVKFYISDRTLKGNFAAGVLCDMRDGTIAKFPAADVEPVRHGRWVHDHYENCSDKLEIVKCSCCGNTAYAIAFYVKSGNYCPNCGCLMDGGAE